MINIQVRSVIHTLRNLLMPQTENNVKRLGSMPENLYRGLKFTFDVSVSFEATRTYQKSKQVRSTIEVLIVGDHYAFVACKDFASREETSWDNVGNHDSCWIDSVESKLSKIYFDMCNATGAGGTPPADLRQQSWFYALGPSIEYVEVRMEWDDILNVVNGSQYWRKIKIIRPISQLDFLAYAYLLK